MKKETRKIRAFPTKTSLWNVCTTAVPGLSVVGFRNLKGKV